MLLLLILLLIPPLRLLNRPVPSPLTLKVLALLGSFGLCELVFGAGGLALQLGVFVGVGLLAAALGVDFFAVLLGGGFLRGISRWVRGRGGGGTDGAGSEGFEFVGSLFGSCCGVVDGGGV